MDKRKNSKSGGAAVHLGIGYQDCVAAWMCVRILAEQEAHPLWDWSANTTLTFLYCETDQPVDDILLGTSQHGLAFINVKRTVTASLVGDSDFASALSQFVRQFITLKNQPRGSRLWERPLDEKLDRFILITSAATAAVKKHLTTVLERIRSLNIGQEINDAAKTEDERDILGKVKSHVQEVFVQSTGEPTSEQELIGFLRLIRIEVLEVETNGTHEREAKDRLRASVLQNAEKADVAWGILTRTCANWASQRIGGTREQLQAELLRAGIALKAPRGFRLDIEKLKEHSDRTFRLLRPLSVIEMGSKEIKIQRPVSHALREAAENDSIVVVGEPGAGKSGVLHDLVETLRNENRNVVFLAVDKLEAQSLQGLQQELLLDHDLCQVLQNWTGTTPGFLVIDALDAARSPTTAQTFYDLLELLLAEPTRWRVITSIRQYDLRYNTKLRSIFSGQPPSQFHSPEFFSLRHLNIPRLSDEEWLQIPAQSLELAKLFLAADETLRELLYVPFNIKLTAELLGRGIEIEQLTPIRTQIELLDLYWAERVAKPLEEKDAREILLERAVQAMVKTRSMRVGRRQVATATADSPILKSILSAHILSGQPSASGETVNDDILTFAHHVLYDYAVARLLLRTSPQPLIKLLENDPELIIAIRPSLVMHFEYERWQGLQEFWELIFSLNRSQAIPEIGKLIGSSVAVEAATDIEEFSPLIQSLYATESVMREGAEKAFRHVAGALMVKGINNATFIGPRALNWGELLDQATTTPRATTIYAACPVLDMLCAQPELLTQDQRQSASIVARRILEFALSQSNRNLGLVISGIQTVCRTYESDVIASGALLRRCLVPEHVLQHGHEELFRFGHEIERLIPIDPLLVEDIYKAAFTMMDHRGDRTPMGNSQIVAMTTTPHQNFELARYALAQKYNQFVHQSPINALRVLIAALTTYSSEQYSYWERPASEEPFDFNGRQARIKSDRSEWWAQRGSYRDHEKPINMLRVFEHYLDQIGSNEESADLRQQLIDLLIAENNTAVLWQMLLEVATKHAQALGLQICPLAWALPILTCEDTSRPVGDYLKAGFQYFPAEYRVQTEQAICTIPTLVNEENREYAERKRNRLLGCLAAEAIVTEETKSILPALREAKDVPSNEPRFYAPQVTSPYVTDEDMLRDSNVPLEEEANRKLLALLEPAKAFVGRFLNGSPNISEIQEIIPALHSLYPALLSAAADGCHERTQDLAWGYFANACESVAKSEDFNSDLPYADLIQTALLAAAKYPYPSPDAYQDWGEQASWGSPAARIDAAKGMMWLASKPSCVNSGLLEAIERLANDPCPPVRFMIATRLNLLYHSAPDLMWRWLETFSKTENNKGILHFLVAGPLNQLVPFHADRIAEVVYNIFDRVRGDEKAPETRQACARIFTGLHIWQGQEMCRELAEMFADDPAKYSTEANSLAFDLRSQLNLGPVESPNIEQDQVRQRSFALLHRLLSSTLRQEQALNSQYPNDQPFSSWSEADQERGQRLARLADSICMQFYFASGAHQDNEAESKVIRGAAERIRFWNEARPSLELLAEFGYAQLVHHLLETLEYLLPFDPVNVFLLIGKVVEKGKAGGYQNESLAVELIVKVVERYIAERRHHLQENEGCRHTLIKILDTFVEAGWPSARRLTYRLQDIYR
jgi:signal recognition particle GTPase